MTAARAAIRRGLAISPKTQSLFQNFELEWLASTIASTNGSRWKVPATDTPPWTYWVVLGNEDVQLDSSNDARNSTDVHARSSDLQHKDGSQEGSDDDSDETNDEDSEDDSEDDSKDSSENDSRDSRDCSERDGEGGSEEDSEDKSDKDNAEEGSEDNNGKISEESCGETSSNIGAYSDGPSDAGNNCGHVNSRNGIEAAHQNQDGSANESNDEHPMNKINSKAQTVMILRSQFAKSTGWQSPVFTEANSLSRAIEVVMNTLFLNSGLTQFNWPLRAMYNGQEPQVIDVSMNLVNGNWRVSRHDVEAILSLWIFSMKHAPKDVLASREIDTTTNGPGVHLLGADTPQLRRDVKWWIPQDIRKVMIVRENPEGSLVVGKSLVVGCGRATKHKVKLERIELNEDDNNPPYGKAVEKGFLAVESFQPPASLFSLSLFSSFLSTATRTMNEPIEGQAEVKPNDSRKLGSWTSFTLHHTSLSKMASEVQSTGLATLSEAYSVIVPSLSIENKLPSIDNVIELAREHAKPYEERNDMRRATDVYLWLMRTANLFPPDTPFVLKSMAVTLEHLRQVIKSIKLSNRLRLDCLLGMRIEEKVMLVSKENELLRKIESELQLDKIESRSTFAYLMGIYSDQGRLEIFPSRLIKIAKQDPIFQQPTPYKSLSKDEQFAETDAVTGWTKLHWSATNRYATHSVARELEKGIDPNTRDFLGYTPLHLACQTGEVSMATLLVRNGADVNARTRNASTPLHYAARDGHLRVVELLITLGAESNVIDAAGMIPAMWAALEGWEDVLKYLLRISGLSLRDSGGRAVLHHAALSGSSGIVDVFERGVDTEVRDYEGRTPLHLAVFSGDNDALSILTKKLKANTCALDNYGNHWLHFAAVRGQIDIMDRLISEFNVDVNCENRDRETPLHLVVRTRESTVIEAVIKRNPNLEARNRIGETPLMVACRLGRIKIVKQLVNSGADRHTTDNYGSSLLIAAVSGGHKKVAGYLLNKGVNKDHQRFLGLTALHFSAKDGKSRLVQMLINEKAAKDKLDYNGMTPLHHAAEQAHSEVVEMLLKAGANIEAKDHQGWTALHHAASGTSRTKYLSRGRRRRFPLIRAIDLSSSTDWKTSLINSEAQGAEKQSIDGEGKTMDLNRERTLRLLLNGGAEKQSVDEEGKTARQLAEELGNRRVVELLDIS
ncbi:ankyrin repeat [Fusarium pseudocircinatum]|uniref:Ankyrin repeat n=1 Tax=Fusarium pseudocircinatum TaxID=56676 RepID=A0A8H5PJU2_9HYPO|nr:ankyrin repeat [Fusarium pseudocircinatum]